MGDRAGQRQRAWLGAVVGGLRAVYHGGMPAAERITIERVADVIVAALKAQSDCSQAFIVGGTDDPSPLDEDMFGEYGREIIGATVDGFDFSITVDYTQ